MSRNILPKTCIFRLFLLFRPENRIPSLPKAAQRTKNTIATARQKTVNCYAVVISKCAHPQKKGMQLFCLQLEASCLQLNFLLLNTGGKSAINLSNICEILPILTPGYLFMLGRLAASKFIYARPVASPHFPGVSVQEMVLVNPFCVLLQRPIFHILGFKGKG